MNFEEYIHLYKKKSVAILFTDGEKFLVVRPTKKNFYELPKGEIEDGENVESSAVREFYEETGIQLSKSKLKKVGKFSFHQLKDIILYTYYVDKLPPTGGMKCSSLVVGLGEPFPEVDNYRYVKLHEYEKIRKEFWPIMKHISWKMRDINFEGF